MAFLHSGVSFAQRAVMAIKGWAGCACYAFLLFSPRRYWPANPMNLALALLLLIALNGVFAMAEIAVVSSRKARLQKMADEGTHGAGKALLLHDEPSSFLSTVQVGITSIGILSGVVGEDALAQPLETWLAGFALLTD